MCLSQPLRSQWGQPARLEWRGKHALQLGIGHRGGGPHPQRGHAGQYLVAGRLRKPWRTVGSQARRALGQGHQQSGLGVAQAGRRLPQVGATGHFNALHLPTHGCMVDVQREDVAFAQMPFQLQGTRHLAQLGAHGSRGRATGRVKGRVVHLQDARNLHGQCGATRHHAPVPRPLTQRSQHGHGVDAGVPVKPTVFVVAQRLQVQRRHGLGLNGMPQRPVGAGPGAQRRAVGRQHHQCAGCRGSLKGGWGQGE